MTHGELMLYSMAQTVRENDDRYKQAMFTCYIVNSGGFSKKRMTPEKMLGLARREDNKFNRENANQRARDAFDDWYDQVDEEFNGEHR